MLTRTYLERHRRLPGHLRRGAQLATLCLILTACSTPQSTQPGSPLVSPCNRLQTIDLPAQRLAATIQALTQASNCFVTRDRASPATISVPAVHGELSIAAALSRALRGSGLSLSQQGNTLTLR